MSRELRVIPVPGYGAEDVLVTEAGVFTGTKDGSIFRITRDGDRIERVAATGGRPLGIESLPDGQLLVCDAQSGLLSVDPESGSVTTLVREIDGRPMRFCNNAAVSSNGDIYFSDSSTEYSIEQWKADLIEDTRTGRLLVRRADGSVEVLLTALAFANGVALAPDESFVAVAETGARTLVRLWLTGDRAGQRDLLVDDLPGYPDNISRGSDGLIWVSIASPTDPVVEAMQRGPILLRRSVTKIPAAIQPKPKRTVRAMAFRPGGALARDEQVATDRFHMVTGVREHSGQLWLGSLEEPAIAVLDLD
ncbi:MAG: SMP-30/gluconolactonase/LRE family protein [Micrococcales bacterium]|nr:SMP-30/gluconolactonase/LRE family protein [Micrococcales bacterium]